MIYCSVPTVPKAVKVRVIACSATLPVSASSKTSRELADTLAYSGSEPGTFTITESYYGSTERVTELKVTVQKAGVTPVTVDG